MAGPDYRALGFTNVAASGRRPGIAPMLLPEGDTP
jgi:hypothetical protein